MRSFFLLLIVILWIFVGFVNTEIYAYDHLDHQELASVTQFCQNNDQASDLCYLLAQDLVDYQNLEDLKLEDSLIDYAHSAGAISIPIFLRYLPALAKLAKNNMIIASVFSLVGGAMAFKNYYDSYVENLLIKVGVFDPPLQHLSSERFQEKVISKLKKSKSYQYYSQKGPEFEHKKMLPAIVREDTKVRKELDNQTQKYVSFLGSIKQRFISSHRNLDHGYYDFLEDNFLDHLTLKFNSSFDVDDNIKMRRLTTKLAKFELEDLNEIEKLVVKASSNRFFIHAKYNALNFSYTIVWSRNHKYRTLIENKKAKNSSIIVGQAKKIWDALLLEDISLNELLKEKQSPLFEENIYLPFLKKQLISIKRFKEIEKITKPSFFESFFKPTDKYSSHQQLEDLFLIPSDLYQPTPLLPSVYLNLTGFDINQLKIYFGGRTSILVNHIHLVENRLDTWNRKNEFKFLPGNARSTQAMKNWSELFELAHN